MTDHDDEVSTDGEQLDTVQQVARQLQVPPSWVYTHAAQLGALKVGDICASGRRGCGAACAKSRRLAKKPGPRCGARHGLFCWGRSLVSVTPRAVGVV